MVKQSLSIEIAKAGLDLFFQENSSRHIRFYGPGEPTQEIELMKMIVAYAKDKDKRNLTVELQTNGVFSGKDCKWLLDNINIMWISFDGEPEVHDKQRHFPNGNPSSPIIEKNIKWLLENRVSQNFMVGVRVTITNDNISRQKNMVDYFLSLGIKHIWSDPVFPEVGMVPAYKNLSKFDLFQFDMDKYVDTFIEARQYADEMGVFYGSFLTCNFDGATNKHCRACTPVPHFTPDGYISACDLVTFGENAGHMDCFVYGKWIDSEKRFYIDTSKVEALQKRTTSNMKHCKGCDVRKYCGGYCLGEVQNETGSLTGQKPQACKAIKRLAKIIGFADKPYPYLHP
jgi:radical SAM protein with 4Fe4S-binding SPASM domain